MSKVRVHISSSLDGYVAGPNQSTENPLGEGGEGLHDWVVALKAWREASGTEGGEENASSPVVREEYANVGAEIMGRGKFGPAGRGPWGDDPWQGWWGDAPPFHKPVCGWTTSSSWSKTPTRRSHSSSSSAWSWRDARSSRESGSTA